jgi:NADP-dependent aldehyde dehydrogenase
MQHGGPWPASTSSSHTSVGAASIRRFVRPIAYQSAPEALLPLALRDRNELGIPRRIDGIVTTADVTERSA